MGWGRSVVGQAEGQSPERTWPPAASSFRWRLWSVCVEAKALVISQGILSGHREQTRQYIGLCEEYKRLQLPGLQRQGREIHEHIIHWTGQTQERK